MKRLFILFPFLLLPFLAFVQDVGAFVNYKTVQVHLVNALEKRKSQEFKLYSPLPKISLNSADSSLTFIGIASTDTLDFAGYNSVFKDSIADLNVLADRVRSNLKTKSFFIYRGSVDIAGDSLRVFIKEFLDQSFSNQEFLQKMMVEPTLEKVSLRNISFKMNDRVINTSLKINFLTSGVLIIASDSSKIKSLHIDSAEYYLNTLGQQSFIAVLNKELLGNQLGKFTFDGLKLDSTVLSVSDSTVIIQTIISGKYQNFVLQNRYAAQITLSGNMLKLINGEIEKLDGPVLNEYIIVQKLYNNWIKQNLGKMLQVSGDLIKFKIAISGKAVELHVDVNYVFYNNQYFLPICSIFL